MAKMCWILKSVYIIYAFESKTQFSFFFLAQSTVLSDPGSYMNGTYGNKTGNNSIDNNEGHWYIYVQDLDQYLCTDINCTYGNKA